MEKEPLISAIVPIYMIERYVGICIESLMNQTYRNLEIILVDDGSKDRCSEICDLYARKDSRITVIHKANGGLVSGRKAGLQASSGDYIGYVDGDDWVDPSYYEDLYRAIREADADLACAGQRRDLFDQSVALSNPYPAGIYEGEALQTLYRSMLSYGSYYRPGVTTYVWNKLFRREVLLEAEMAVDNRITIGEAAAVTYPVLLKCRRVCITDNTGYHYRQREDSMLKQSASFVNEAEKLKILYEYLMRWADAEGTGQVENLKKQIDDYVLSICIIRSGGRTPAGQTEYSAFAPVYYGKNVVVYSAGTFGQQLMNRFRETMHCQVVGWIDDDYWEYRRCCLDVDPVESIAAMQYDYVLIASLNGEFSDKAAERLTQHGVAREQILTVSVPETAGEKEALLQCFFDIEQLRLEEEKRKR